MSTETNQGAKVTLYWLDKSRSQRIVWLLEELKVDYELKVFKRGKDMLAPQELKDIHPLGKSPVIGVQAPGADKHIVVAESGVIVEYLTEYFGKWMIPKRYPEGKEGVIGAETEEWQRYRYYMHYAEGSFMTMLLMSLLTQNMRNAPVPFFLKPIGMISGAIANKIDGSFVMPQIKGHLAFLEEQLATAPNGGGFFCGNSLTGADIMMIFGLEGAMQRVPITEQSHPNVYHWIIRMQQRDANKRAAEKVTEATGEPYVPISKAKF
ncbi:glutathione transferase [Mytilinidion resinicola]|uniref:glutathione transferase n=1 Tax=Mytilinidion resinicola TaxID=574789 RepID=A0A6A6Z770_9PEZI|nr:glutathione transferase [Mytilinidion resinicola]KAF2816095.1 glutathione transferase [Mytilinidion resinicola]